jgi:hypothetical protein
MEKPPWLVALTTILSVFFAAGIQSPLLVYVVHYIKRWTRLHVVRKSELEEMIDPKRTSSGLTSEGTDPEETGNDT